MSKIDKVLQSIGIGLLAFVLSSSLISATVSLVKVEKVETQQKYYENKILENDIYWLKEMHKLELENAKNNDLENRIQELEGFIDNYEDLLEIYFNWLRNNPNGTQEEFELYLFANHRWLYEWAVSYE